MQTKIIVLFYVYHSADKSVCVSVTMPQVYTLQSHQSAILLFESQPAGGAFKVVLSFVTLYFLPSASLNNNMVDNVPECSCAILRSLESVTKSLEGNNGSFVL